MKQPEKNWSALTKSEKTIQKSNDDICNSKGVDRESNNFPWGILFMMIGNVHIISIIGGYFTIGHPLITLNKTDNWMLLTIPFAIIIDILYIPTLLGWLFGDHVKETANWILGILLLLLIWHSPWLLGMLLLG